jgi:hypothetical protein
MVMKKILTAIILVAYFSVSTGFIISTHFCMDRFSSAQIGGSTNDVCGKCGMHKDGGCCHDEIKVVKLNTSHVVSQVKMPSLVLAATPASTPVNYSFTSLPQIANDCRSNSQGPPVTDLSLHVLICVFRI